jgi:hypothetical protein
MIEVNYQKRKNQELFKTLEEKDSLFLSKIQNYIPIYQKFFTLNETNYNNINLNQQFYITEVNDRLEENINVFNCKVKNINNSKKIKDKQVFFKLAPLLDPYKYLIGKYNTTDTNLFNLPDLNSNNSNNSNNTNNTNIQPKIIDINNSAYVDGLFFFLSSFLCHNNNFINGVDYYGSFLAIKNDFKINVFDDLEYLISSDFFNKNKNSLFTVDNYDHIFKEENTKLKPIKIEYNSSIKSNTSIKSINNELYEDIFENNNHIDLNDLKNMSIDLIDISEYNFLDKKNDSKTTTIKSDSSCSSRTSHTSTENSIEIDDSCSDDKCIDSKCSGDDSKCSGDDKFGGDDSKCGGDDNESNWEDIESDNEEIDENIQVTIPQFPVQVICLEKCENTFDDLILNNELSQEEWFSSFMQIIMILITYQKTFAFTHNDLHTNNVMYINTTKKFIYYCYKNKHYKVPTFGRIFKIIDFGRSIYKFNGKTFCSDSFQSSGDAATQYNTEPYFNEKKPRLEPNYSFDICRLACSIFDYVVDDLQETKNLDNCDPVKRLIIEWCLDDKGLNLLYKTNGDDRYPDFKLYKMIARCVHNHTPQAQLERPEFMNFEYTGKITDGDVIDIDKIPVCV